MAIEAKQKLSLILSVIAAILFLIALGSCSKIQRLRVAHDKETSRRFDAEDKMNKIFQEKTALEESLKNKEKELSGEKASHEATKKTLLQERLINQSLQEELVKLTKSNRALEEELKNAKASKEPSKK